MAHHFAPLELLLCHNAQLVHTPLYTPHCTQIRTFGCLLLCIFLPTCSSLLSPEIYRTYRHADTPNLDLSQPGIRYHGHEMCTRLATVEDGLTIATKRAKDGTLNAVKALPQEFGFSQEAGSSPRRAVCRYIFTPAGRDVRYGLAQHDRRRRLPGCWLLRVRCVCSLPAARVGRAQNTHGQRAEPRKSGRRANVIPQWPDPGAFGVLARRDDQLHMSPAVSAVRAVCRRVCARGRAPRRKPAICWDPPARGPAG